MPPREQLAWGGGTVGGAYGTLRHWLGVSLGSVAPTAANPAFGAREWHSALELGWQPAWAAGAQVTLGLGPSVLVVEPRADITSRSGTVVSTLFLELSISRPIWLGQFALEPDVGARLFTTEQGVKIDARERLTLAGLAPRIGLGVVYRAR